MTIYNPFTLDGKVILVTGASSGIGKQIALESSKMGAQLIITGRNKVRLGETLEYLSWKNHKQIIADLSVEEEIESLVSKLPSIDGIVHAASSLWFAFLLFLPAEFSKFYVRYYSKNGCKIHKRVSISPN
jgi:short-subunit dehydrogenase